MLTEKLNGRSWAPVFEGIWLARFLVLVQRYRGALRAGDTHHRLPFGDYPYKKRKCRFGGRECTDRNRPMAFLAGAGGRRILPFQIRIERKESACRNTRRVRPRVQVFPQQCRYEKQGERFRIHGIFLTHRSVTPWCRSIFGRRQKISLPAGRGQCFRLTTRRNTPKHEFPSRENGFMKSRIRRGCAGILTTPDSFGDRSDDKRPPFFSSNG